MQYTCIMRTNIYQQKISDLLHNKHLMTIAEIHSALPEADYSTVFRNIEQLLEQKQIKKVIIDNKTVAYESCGETHDHFICNDCGVVESIHMPRKLISGYKIEDVTVRGVCGDCDKC
jgi:Fe2+ or Zn2+ uptake regulation protein